MHKLHEIQRDFSRAVWQTSPALPKGIKAGGTLAWQGLAIYRNNTRIGLTEALRDRYPVVNRLVGERFFDRLALAYLQAYPPQSSVLLWFGGQLAEFVATFSPAQDLVYLADIARLEWYWHEAYHEADGRMLTIAKLASLDPDCYGRMGFDLQPSARFIASRYPIQRIWACNQADCEAEDIINLGQGGCRLLLFRPALEVEMHSLTDAEYRLLTALAGGSVLAEIDADFEVGAALQKWLYRGLFTDFFIR